MRLQLCPFSQLLFVFVFGTPVLILGRFRIYGMSFKIRPEIEVKPLIYITSMVQINFFQHKNDNIRDDDQVGNKKGHVIN